MSGINNNEIHQLSFISFTSGEKGIPDHSRHLSPTEMKSIREKEFRRSAQALQATPYLLGFPDLELSFIPLETLVKPLLKIVREKKITELVTFHPYELTPFIDHPDHNRVGEVTRVTGTAADVTHFLPDIPAIRSRPSLSFWTTQPTNIQYQYSTSLRKKRFQHMFAIYPSQFHVTDSAACKKIFSRFNEEHYINIR